MIFHVFKKDWVLLWPLAALVAAIQVGLEWALYSVSAAEGAPAAVELIRPLTLAWFAGIAVLSAAAVHQDPLPGTDQDWLIRPLRRMHLLIAKMVFLWATVCLPMFVINLTHAVAIGFAPVAAAGILAYKEIYVFAFLIVPVLALAASTRNMAELAFMGAALVVVYAAALVASAGLLGGGRCAVCGSGLVWQDHLLQRVGVAVGAGVILGLQYFKRKTSWSRVLALCGAALLVFAELPWNVAFAIQQRLAGESGGAPLVLLPGAAASVGTAVSEREPLAARQATRAVLHGDVDQALALLHRPRARDGSVELNVTARVTGLRGDEILLTDRSAIRVTGAGGSVLFQTATAGDPLAMTVAASGELNSTFRVPPAVPEAMRTGDAHARLSYSFTRLVVRAQQRIAATDGEWRSAVAGLCRSSFEDDGISLHCRQMGRAPFCYSATLYGPAGSHNPEVFKCRADYRPYLPALPNILAYFGLNLPVRDKSGMAHYPVDAAQLADAYLVMKIYAVSEHFVRAVADVPFRVTNDRPQGGGDG